MSNDIPFWISIGKSIAVIVAIGIVGGAIGAGLILFTKLVL